jgi:hypothetical protein
MFLDREGANAEAANEAVVVTCVVEDEGDILEEPLDLGDKCVGISHDTFMCETANSPLSDRVEPRSDPDDDDLDIPRRRARFSYDDFVF